MDARHRKLLLGALGEAQCGSVLQKELVDFDFAGLVLVLRHLKEADDGIFVGYRHGTRDALRGVGHIDGHAGTEHQHAVGVQLPENGLLLQLFAAVGARLGGRGDETCGGEHILTQEAVGHHKHPVASHLLCAHQALAHDAGLGRLLLLSAVVLCEKGQGRGEQQSSQNNLFHN